jgi:hypothetical protein
VIAVLFGITVLVYGVLTISLQHPSSSVDSQASIPYLKSDDNTSLVEEGKSLWTRMKSFYRKDTRIPDETTALLHSTM